jgi:HEAT repeat protein
MTTSSQKLHTAWLTLLVLGIVAVLALTGWKVVWPVWLEHRAVQALVEALLADHPRDFDTALEAVHAVRGGSGAVSVLVQHLEYPDIRVRTWSADALGKLGAEAVRAVPALIDAEADEDSVVREQACRALAHIGSPALPALIRALEHEDPQVRGWSAEALGEIGDQRAVAPLVARLDREDEVDVVIADLARALGRIALEDAGVRAALGRAMARHNPRSYRGVPYGLNWLGADVVPFLATLLHDDDPRVRAAAAQALNANRGAVAALPELIEALGDDDPSIRIAGACVLVNLGPLGKPAVDRLLEILDDPDGNVRVWAALAFWKVSQQPEPAIAAFIAALEDPASAYHGMAAQALSEMGPQAKVAIPAMIQAMRHIPKDRTEDSRWAVAGALGEFGSDARDAVPEIIAALRDPELAYRYMVARALGNIGVTSPEVLRALEESLEPKDPLLLEEAAAAIRKLPIQNKPSTP